MKKVPSLPQTLLPGLQILATAHSYAEKTKRPGWDYAVEIRELYAVGCTNNDLRCLLALGLAERKMEIQGSGKRRFGKNQGQSFTNGCCFVLTDLGKSVARRLHFKETDASFALAEHLAAPRQVSLDPAHQSNPHLPHYDADCHTLFLNGEIVKQFNQPAELQELILKSFEEENWSPHLADPLPGKAGMIAKRRLNGAISKLNAHQITPLLRFRGDGTGTGVLWEERR